MLLLPKRFHPDFSNPGKQPTGSVIPADNPILRDCRHLWFFRDGYAKADLLNKAPGWSDFGTSGTAPSLGVKQGYRGLTFSGSEDIITATNFAFGSAGTNLALVNFDGVGSAGAVFDCNTAENRLHQAASGQLIYRTDTTSTTVSSGVNVPTGTWGIVAGGFDGTDIFVFGFGGYNTASETTTPPSDRQLNIGARNIGGSWYLNGRVAYAAYFDRRLSQEELWSLDRDPWQLFAPAVPMPLFGAAGGAVSVAISAATETDSAQPISISMGIGAASEADSAIALTADVSAALGTTTEADSAFALDTFMGIGTASETDSPIALGVSMGIGTTSETDSALTVTPLTGVVEAIGTASETDSAIVLDMSMGVGAASETDSAITLTAEVVQAISLAAETDSSFTVNVILGIGTATETDSAFPIAGGEAIGGGQRRGLGLYLGLGL